MKKFSKKLVALLLAAVMLCSVLPFSVFAEGAANVYKNGIYTAEKISNPTTWEGEADGLMPGGDRMNSYAWCMEQLGDYIYIGCNRDILYQCVTAITQQLPIDPEVINKICNVVTNGEIPVPEAGTNLYTPCIFRYNIVTEKMEVYFDSSQHPEFGIILGFRGAKAFNGALYMNSQQMDLQTMSAVSGLYRITNDSELPEVVYDVDGHPVGGGGNLRAMTLSEDGKELVMGGTEAVNKQSGETFTFKPVVYQTKDGIEFNKIADFEDDVFKPYINQEPLYFDGGADVLDVAQYHGEYYLSIYTRKGALVFKGHPAQTGETGNKYGWVWTEFVGDHGGIYDIGFVGSEATKGASPYVFNDQLYFLTFSDCFGPMTDAVVGYLMYLLSSQQEGMTPDINLIFEGLKSMEASIENQTAVYRMNQNQKMEMLVGNKNKCDGTNIEYVGNLGAGFNGLERGLTVYNWRAAVYNDKLYMGTFDAYSLFKYATKLTNGDLLNMSADEFRQQLVYVKELLEAMAAMKETDVTPETLSNDNPQTEDVPRTQEDEKVIAAQAYEATPQVEKTVVEDTEKQTAEALSDEFQPETTEAVEKLDDKVIDDIIDALVMIQQSLDKEATVDSIHKALENIPEAAEQLTKVQRRLGYLCWRYRHHPVLHKVLRTAHDAVKQVADQLNAVDQEGLERYIRISKTLAEHQDAGFELYSTKDGINYDPVTLNGFNDKYNYGVRTLVPTEKGLFLGTANPFYGAQLWKITDGDEKKPQPTPDPTPVNPEVKKVNTGLQATDTTMPAVLGLSLTALLITGLFVWTKRKAMK